MQKNQFNTIDIRRARKELTTSAGAVMGCIIGINRMIGLLEEKYPESDLKELPEYKKLQSAGVILLECYVKFKKNN